MNELVLQYFIALNMIDQEIFKLKIQRNHLYEELNQVNTLLLVKSQELNEIAMEQEENYNDQYERIEENINFMSKKIVELNTFCKESLGQKKKITENIKKYTEKRQSLTSILDSQNRKLDQIKASNLQIEEQIKQSRLQYEYLQDDIFNLDIKIQNFKKYGMEIIPEDIALKLAKKQELAQQKLEIDKRIEIQKAELETMHSIQQKEKITKAIQEFELKNKKISELAKAIKVLKVENEALTKIKNQYEWNPNLEIKQLEINEQQQAQKICSIDREISAIRKKSTECQQKIQYYKNYIKKQETLRKQKQLPNEVDEISLKKSKYSEIKRDIQLQANKQSVSLLDSVRELFKKKSQNTESIIIDTRTYRMIKKINLFQFLIVLVVLLALLYYSHKVNKRT